MSKYTIGDKVIFIDNPDKLHAWKLINGGIYEIESLVFDLVKQKTFYSVKGYGSSTNWFEEEDLITIIEARKLKLKKLWI